MKHMKHMKRFKLETLVLILFLLLLGDASNSRQPHTEEKPAPFYALLASIDMSTEGKHCSPDLGLGEYEMI
jgi:hypothetical protein